MIARIGGICVLEAEYEQRASSRRLKSSSGVQDVLLTSKRVFPAIVDNNTTVVVVNTTVTTVNTTNSTNVVTPTPVVVVPVNTTTTVDTVSPLLKTALTKAIADAAAGSTIYTKTTSGYYYVQKGFTPANTTYYFWQYGEAVKTYNLDVTV